MNVQGVGFQTSLFARQPKKLSVQKKVIQRMPLIHENTCLVDEIAKLSIPDEWIRLKKQLNFEIKNLPTVHSLTHELNALTDKIRPASCLYFPSKDEGHLTFMLSSIENVLKQLPQRGAERVNALLTRLRELYLREQGLHGKESYKKYSCSLVGIVSGYRYIPQEVMNHLLPLDAEGRVIKSLKGFQSAGTRAVNTHGKIYCKNDPESPSYQYAWDIFLKIFAHLTTAPTQFVRLHKPMEGASLSFNVQLSLEVEGERFDKIIQEQPHLLAKCDSVLYGLTAISHMIGCPQDATENNYKVRLEKDKDGNVVNVLWKGYDDDRWGVHPICEMSDKNHLVNMRSLFLCLKQVQMPIHHSVRQHYSLINPAAGMLQFLQEMAEYNQHLCALQAVENIPQEKLQGMFLPFLLVKDLAQRMYQKLCTVKQFMQTALPDKTYMDLWKNIDPPIAYYYDRIIKRYPHDPYAAFVKIFRFNGPVFESEMQGMLGLPLSQGGGLLSDYLKNCKHRLSDYEVLRDTTPQTAAEGLLENDIDFTNYSMEEQKEILKVLKSFPISKVTLRNCLALNDIRVADLIHAQPGLQQLSLLGCENVTEASLDCIFYRHPDLRITADKCPGLIHHSFQSFAVERGNPSQNASPVERQQPRLLENQTLDNLTKALESVNWEKIKHLFLTITHSDVKSQATVLIFESLLNSDQMGQIVKLGNVDNLEFLASLGFRFSHRNTKDESIFDLCCEEGNVPMLEWLCRLRIKWDELVSQKGRGPAHIAVIRGHLGCLKVLKEANAPLEQADKSLVTPLRLALELGERQTAKWLIECGLNLFDALKNKQNLLHLACQKGFAEIVDLLLAKTPELKEMGNDKGRIPLFDAIEYDRWDCFQKVLNRILPKDFIGQKGRALLKMAVELDRLEMMTALINVGANPLEVDEDGANIVHLAARCGAVRCLKFLLGVTQFSLESALPDGKTLLHLAALEGNPDIIRLVCLSTSLTKSDSNQMTPAHYAAQGGKWGALVIMLDAGFPIDFQGTARKETLLMYAFRGHHYDIAERLIARQASLLTADHRHFTVVHRAALEGDVELLRYLKENHNFDVNIAAKNLDKATPLYLAAARGHLAVIDALLSLGANPNCTNSDGKTPLFIAVQNGHDDAMRRLISGGADVSRSMKDGMTLVHYAANWGHPRLIEYLLTMHPGMVNSKTRDEGHTPLHRAMYQHSIDPTMSLQEWERCCEKQVEVIRTLLRFGADVNAADHYKYVPLHLALKMGRPDFVAYLLSQGAKIYLRNTNGKTPREFGIDRGAETKEGPIKQGIIAACQLLKSREEALDKSKPTVIRSGSFLGYERALSDQLQKPLEERQKSILYQLKQFSGFRLDTLILLRSIEENSPSSSFLKQLSDSLREKQNLPPRKLPECKPRLLVNLPLTVQQIRDRWLIPEVDLDEACSILACERNPSHALMLLSDVFQISPALSEKQLKTLFILLDSLKGYDGFLADDFSPEFRTALINHLHPFKKGDFKELMTPIKQYLESPSRAIKPSHAGEWRKIEKKEHRKKILTELEGAIHKTNHDRERHIEQFASSLMSLHRELFMQMHLSDLRFAISDNSQSALAELLRVGRDLKANSLIFLLNGQSFNEVAQRLEFVIEWICKSAALGDFHQTLSLYEAVSHPAVVRLRKAFDLLSKTSRRLLADLEVLFQPADDYVNYFTLLDSRLSPSMPSLLIYVRLFADREDLLGRSALMRHVQGLRFFARQLILPRPAEDSLLMLTPEMYPTEHKMSEVFAWRQSHRLKQPNLKQEVIYKA
ncbi:MAG: ankyrin repeat domain-containing protein [Parachlamydia sp.]|nr:ankyrin repeat domain-containing protein [Parachlamydia sp.]